MIKLPGKKLSKKASAHLAGQQKKVDGPLLSQKEKVELATELWSKKKNGEGQAAFTDVRKKLNAMTIRRAYCHYCEWNQERDIEHFFPKKHFPNKAFVWENYLQACTICNSDHKGEKFAIFKSDGTTVEHLPNKKNYYVKPNTEDNVLINPRKEDPSEYLMIDFKTGKFVVKPGIDNRGIEKAKYTYETLGLNSRDGLVRDRKNAVENYRGKLEKYVNASMANSFIELSQIIKNKFDLTLNTYIDFTTEKERLKNHFKNDILNDPFPSAWVQLKQQRQFYKEVDALFAKCPEALTW